MFDSTKEFTERFGKPIVRSLPWAIVTTASVGLYLMEHRRVNQMIKANAEREEKTEKFNAWLKLESIKLEQTKEGES